MVVGYVVQGGYVADPNDPTEKYTPDGWTTPLLAAPEATWVNTASVSGAKVTVGEVETTVDANRCSTPVPPGWVAEGNDPEDTRGYPDCKTWHSLKESCFHIRKHGISGADQEVTNELLGSEFLIADTKEGDGVQNLGVLQLPGAAVIPCGGRRGDTGFRPRTHASTTS